jgi:hypothetical protein
MKKLLVIALLIASPAMAQDVTLKVNNAELGLIGKGLGTLPFNDVAPLMNKLQSQVVEQQKAPEKTVDKPSEPVKK